MTRAEVLAWLDARRPAPPTALRARLEASVQDAPGSLPDHLARAGRELLADVLARPGAGRELALDLLTADALITYAFEAQAELDPNGLEALAERTSPGGRATPQAPRPA